MAKPIDHDRKNRIINHVVSHGHAKVNDLAEMLGVTTETVRKDIAWLQEMKTLKGARICDAFQLLS